MAQLPASYTEYADEITPQEYFNPIPDGKYVCIAEDSEWKDTSAGTGRYLKFTWQVVDGPFKGRKVWDQLNLVNPNQQAVEIAHRTLSAICHACGKVGAKDSSELHNIPVVLNVKLSQQAGYDPKNDVKGYEKVTGAAVAGPTQVPAAPRQAASAAPAATGTAKPPWAR